MNVASHARSWIVACLALIFSSAPALPQAAPSAAATDVTVRLFFSQNINRLTFTPLLQTVTLKRCPTCTSQAFSTPMVVTLQTARILVNDKPAQEIEIDGAVRADTTGGRSAAVAGRWRVRPAPDGLHLTVTIPNERYVMAVLASEASPQEPAASLQALAITARSFALTHLQRHNAQGFDLCDSTHCQALRLGPVSNAIRSAVEQTAGETIWFHDRRAPAYFTQNCGGITEDAAQLWGGPHEPWLISHPDPWCQRTPSAWHASLNQEEVQQSLVLAGSPTDAQISNLRVLKRDASGRAATVVIVTAKRQIQLPAATFRFAVGRALGWNRLRSDWYTVNFSAGVAQFDGKGFGHGVGLCQAGAAAMARQQMADARAILGFYFPGADVRISAADRGWHNATGAGWTLFDTTPSLDSTLIETGNAAWRQAHALLGGPQKPETNDATSVSVRIFPSTDLFRASTGQPGWLIGTTRGDTISLQPLRIIEAHETLSKALLHEMLHVLVERESAASTPLWLREGFVEALSVNNPAPNNLSAPQMSLHDVDVALSTASSADQARRAHQAAASSVQRLIRINGIATVREWLRSGVPLGALASAGLR